MEDPALLSLQEKRAVFERNETQTIRTQLTYPLVESKVRQEVLCSKLLPGRSWSLWLDVVVNALLMNDPTSKPLSMWSEEKGVRTLPYSALFTASTVLYGWDRSCILDVSVMFWLRCLDQEHERQSLNPARKVFRGTQKCIYIKTIGWREADAQLAGDAESCRALRSLCKWMPERPP